MALFDGNAKGGLTHMGALMHLSFARSNMSSPRSSCGWPFFIPVIYPSQGSQGKVPDRLRSCGFLLVDFPDFPVIHASRLSSLRYSLLPCHSTK